MSALLNEDVLGCLISFLDINTMENVSQSTEENKKIVGKFQHIYYKNYLIEMWGNEIIEILEKTTKNFRKNLKELYEEYNNQNIHTIRKLLLKFYECVNEEKIKYNSNMFIFIYDITYTVISTQNIAEVNRLPLYNQRQEFIRINELTEGDSK